MKFYVQLIKLLINKFVFRKDTGSVIKDFCENMGVVYIKLAQILATQNYGNVFTEKDRQQLSSICDNCNPVPFEEIENILKEEYGEDLYNIFSYIDRIPIGSASVSQVHRATLRTGKEVAIKIRRKDIIRNMDKEMNRLRGFIHKFGRFVKLGNYTGGDRAIELYLSWIKEETDFTNEKNNIMLYQKFANSVNGKMENTKRIKVPKLYKNYCTKNVIVMEFINDKTINQLELSEENNKKINKAVNSYIMLSFWALLHNQQVVFHGDPHSGNIYIDKNGNIGFLDMGLLFSLTETDEKLTVDFFLAAYSGNYEKLYTMLVGYGQMNETQKEEFKKDCKKYCEKVKNKEVTFYFMDMINVCWKYEFVPPNFLFCMAKAFVCLNGINNFSKNISGAVDLLQQQVVEYLIERSLKDCENIAIHSLTIAPRVWNNILQYGIVKTIVRGVSMTNTLERDLRGSIQNLKELIEMIKLPYSEEQSKEKHL